MDKKKIILIEDEKQLLNSLKFILKTSGYEVAGYDNGFDALNNIKELKNNKEVISLIITDILLPKLTGIDLIKELIKINIIIPTICITAYSNKELLNEIYNIGCIDYIEKPFDKQTLLMRVKKFLNRKNGGMT